MTSLNKTSLHKKETRYNETGNLLSFAYAPLKGNASRPVQGEVISGPWIKKPKVRLSIRSDLDSLKADWLALQGSGDCSAFQTYAFLANWQTHIGSRENVLPCIVAGYGADETLLFIMPFGIKRKFGFGKLVWLGGALCDYQGPLLSSQFSKTVPHNQIKTLWREVRKALPHHDVIELNRLPQRVGGQSNPFLAIGPVTAHASSAHMTRLSASWDEYYNEKRSSGSKKRDRQKRRKLAESGDVSLITTQDRAETEQTIDELIAQKGVTFARMGIANFLERPGYKDFYKSLAVDADAEGLVHVSRLDVGGKTAAVNWGLSFGGRYHYVLASYAEQEVFAKSGPGMIQLMELMRHATETGHEEFDFTIGDEAYKADWCEVETRLFDYLEAATAKGWLALMPAMAYRKLKRFIKQTPVLWQAFLRLRAAAGSLPGVGHVRA